MHNVRIVELYYIYICMLRPGLQFGVTIDTEKQVSISHRNDINTGGGTNSHRSDIATENRASLWESVKRDRLGALHEGRRSEATERSY